MASPLSPRARLILAIALVIAGLFPILAAFDLGPLHRRDINGPPWLGFAAGAVFTLAGLSVATGQASRAVSTLLSILILAGFAAVGNWIAFGPGVRACGAFAAMSFLGFSRQAGDIECRVAFGVGALILDGVLFFIAGTMTAKLLPPGRAAKAVEKISTAVLLASLAPILAPLLLFVLVKSLVEAVLTRIKTGSWPRNEEFIARMRLKRQKEKEQSGKQ